MLYVFLDFFFFLFHSALILFNSLGWLFKKTRKWNLFTLAATFFSWFILGIWYGWGYCVCTDWHWQVRDQLGYHDSERSYIQLLFRKVPGMEIGNNASDILAISVFALSVFMSILLNVRDYKRTVKKLS